MTDRIARGLCYATLLVPLVVVPGVFFPFVTTRAVLFRACVAMGLALLLLKAQLHRTAWEPARDWTFAALLFFLFALTLSAVFGVSPWRSFYGDYERMGGVWAWLHLGGFYLLLRAFLTDDRSWLQFLRLAVGVGAVTSLLGIMEYYQAPLDVSWWTGGRSAPILTTVGNGGMAAAYLLFVVGFATYLAMEAKAMRGRLVYSAAAIAALIAILLTRNRSTVIGIMAGFVVAPTFYLVLTSRRLSEDRAAETRRDSVRRGRRAATALLIGVAVFGAGLVLTSRFAGDSRFTGALPYNLQRIIRTSPSGSDATRILQWKASWDGFLDRPILGYGPENYHVVWSEHMDPEIYKYDPDSRWDRAHNAYLEMLATSGIVGAAALLSLFAALFHTLVRAYRAGRMSAGSATLFAGVLTGYAVYLVFWFFDLNSAMLLIVVGAFISTRGNGGSILRTAERVELSTRSAVILVGVAIALASTLYVHGFETLRAAALVARVNQHTLSQYSSGTAAGGKGEAAVLNDFRKLFDSPAPLSYHTLLIYSQYLRSLSPHFGEIRNDPRRRATLDELFTQSFRVIDREIRRDPRNERIAVHKARIALLAADFYQEPRFFTAAVETLRRAVAMSPRRIQTRQILANAYLLANEPWLAMAQLDSAYRIHPPYGPTHFYLADAHYRIRDHRSAAAWLESGIESGHPAATELLLRVAAGLASTGERKVAASLLDRYLKHKYGPMFLWPDPLSPETPVGEAQIMEMRARLRGGAIADALRPALAANERGCPRAPEPVLSRGEFSPCRRGVSLVDRLPGRVLFDGGYAPSAVTTVRRLTPSP